MSVQLKVAGFAVAGLVAFGVGAASATRQPAAPVRSTVEMIQPASVATVAPTTVVPAPVESTTAPAPVVAPKEAVVPAPVQSPAPAPVVAAPAPAPEVTTHVQSTVVPMPRLVGVAPQIDGHGVPIPTTTAP